jgi:hypothetical protein
MRVQGADAFDGASRFGPDYHLDAPTATKVVLLLQKLGASQKQRELTSSTSLNVLPWGITTTTITGGSRS